MNHQLGLALRDIGVAKLERHEWLQKARGWAELLCKRNGSVTSDDVHYAMEARYSAEPPPHPNCFGALFRDKRFKATGERVQTKRASGHARWIQIWRLA